MRTGLLAAAALAFALLPGCGPAKKSPLDREIMPRFVSESGAADLLAICREIDMPCGWELVPSEAAKASEAVLNQNEAGTARKLLDELVKRRPVYRWFLSPDKKVVNVAPRTVGANDPLDEQVWVSAQDLPAEAVLKQMVESAGLKLVAAPQAPEVYGEAGRPRRVTLKAQGLRLRIALNRLVEVEGKSMWWCAQTADPAAVRCAISSWRSSVLALPK